MSRRPEVKKLARTLRFFTISEIPKYVIMFIPNLSWKVVQEELQLYELLPNSINVRRSLIEKIEVLEDSVLEDMYVRLTVQAAALHSNKKKWMVYKMEGRQIHEEDDPFQMNLSTFNQNLARKFLRNKLNIVSHCVKHDTFLWVGIRVKKTDKNKRMKWSQVMLFAVDPREPYFYFSGQVSDSVLKVLRQYFKCKGITPSCLTGHCVFTLRSILLQKGIADFVTRKDKETPRVTPGGTDDREKYTGRTFDVNLESQTIFIEDKNAVHQGISMPELKGIKIPFTVTLKAKNLSKTLQEMSDMGALYSKDLPEHFQRIKIDPSKSRKSEEN